MKILNLLLVVGLVTAQHHQFDIVRKHADTLSFVQDMFMSHVKKYQAFWDGTFFEDDDEPHVETEDRAKKTSLLTKAQTLVDILKGRDPLGVGKKYRRLGGEMPIEKQELFYKMHQENAKIDDLESRREYDTNQEVSMKMHQRYQQKKQENYLQ